MLLHFLDIDGVSRHALAAERKVADSHCATLIIDGRGHDPFDRQFLRCRLLCDLRGSQPVNRLNKFQLLFNCGVSAVCTDSLDIGFVDELEF